VISFPRLSKKQITKLSDISSDLGIVILASVVIPAVFSGINFPVVFTGFCLAIYFWIVSIQLLILT
jgi:hypothetical protein